MFLLLFASALFQLKFLPAITFCKLTIHTHITMETARLVFWVRFFFFSPTPEDLLKHFFSENPFMSQWKGWIWHLLCLPVCGLVNKFCFSFFKANRKDTQIVLLIIDFCEGKENWLFQNVFVYLEGKRVFSLFLSTETFRVLKYFVYALLF